MQLESENLQKQLQGIFSSSKDNQIDNNQKRIRPFIFETMEKLEVNTSLCLSDLETINKIHEICQQNTKDLIKTRPTKAKRQKRSHLNCSSILSSIHARIVHDVEMALEELDIEIPDLTSSMNEEEESDDDYYLDPHPNPLIVHHH